MKDRIVIEWVNDKKSYRFGYIFRNSRTREVVAWCDEADYHETLSDLLEEGYSVCY